ncbi:hypothetical protein DFH08DRAFT_959210 [Mycena albidolilacea]|uniref:Uncharacterized protein n=1 Tax=Mycena albidolilacea TaxID=1033008 RepID=A0AAD7A3T8_9AGAR|nr:hypothetical protein DFH08DRAFT_959210 [Mycena albidolilacea]
MTAISLATCDADFLRDHRHASDPVFALKWGVSDYNYELIPIKYGDFTGPRIFAVSFFPYAKDVAPGDELYERLCLRFEKHGGVALEECEMFPMRYPTNGAVADFLAAELEAAVTGNKELWIQKFLVPFAPPRISTIFGHSFHAAVYPFCCG